MKIDDQYEQRAWDEYQSWLLRQHQPGPLSKGTTFVKDRANEALDKIGGTAVGDLVERAVDAGAGVRDQAAIAKAWETTMDALMGSYAAAVDAALASVTPEKVLPHYRKHLPPRAELEQLREVPLLTLDKARPDVHRKHRTQMAAANGVTGALAGLQFGGPQFAAVLAADIVSTIGISVRGIAHQLAHYGYDVTGSGEQAYVMTVMQSSMAGSAAAKGLLAQQSRALAIGLAKDKTWAQLNKNVLTQVAAQGFKAVGEKMIKRKLALVLPGLSAVIGLGQGFNHGRNLMEAAHYEGRARLLQDRWDDAESAVDVFDISPIDL